MSKVLQNAMPQSIREAMRRLRTECPTVWKVKVRRRPDMLQGYFAVTYFIQPQKGDPYFSIILHPSLETQFAIFILIHEYAHALAWTTEHPNLEDHGPLFGVAWAKAYQCAANVT